MVCFAFGIVSHQIYQIIIYTSTAYMRTICTKFEPHHTLIHTSIFTFTIHNIFMYVQYTAYRIKFSENRLFCSTHTQNMHRISYKVSFCMYQCVRVCERVPYIIVHHSHTIVSRIIIYRIAALEYGVSNKIHFIYINEYAYNMLLIRIYV